IYYIPKNHEIFSVFLKNFLPGCSLKGFYIELSMLCGLCFLIPLLGWLQPLQEHKLFDGDVLTQTGDHG
ncbi:MAG: hypothetical protein N2Z22_04095, partial [Turneriella sp.]|nr:hypothetical protein [Turneriella sp.]